MYYFREMNRIIGIDPGGTCGIVVLEEGKIASVFNIMSEQFWTNIQNLLDGQETAVVIEDIKPYSLRLTPQVIETCKWIGEAVYRLKNASGVTVELVARSEVKKWCFDAFPEVCVPMIEKKILKKIAKDGPESRLANKDTGEPRKPSFVFVDDQIVKESMKFLFKIPPFKPGFGYKFGLKDHAWQALSVAAYWYHKDSGNEIKKGPDGPVMTLF